MFGRVIMNPPTDISPGVGPGLGPGLQPQTDRHRHAGHLLPSSTTVLVKDVHLLGFKGQFGLNPHHTTRPAGRESVCLRPELLTPTVSSPEDEPRCFR